MSKKARIKNLFSGRNDRRVLFCFFNEEGAHLLGVSFLANRKTQKVRFSFFLGDVSFDRFVSNWRTKMLLWFLFFPFPYTIVASLPPRFAYSAVASFSQERSDAHENVNEDEVADMFGRTLLPELDAHKKQFLNRYGYDDLDVVLNDGAIVDGVVGRTRSGMAVDGVFDLSGTPLSFSFLKTYVAREAFADFSHIIPKRAVGIRMAQVGFSLAFLLAREAKRPFLLFVVHGRETDVWKCSHDEIVFHDSFGFGWRHVADVFDRRLGVDADTCLGILDSVARGGTSGALGKNILAIAQEGLGSLVRGVESFKGSTTIHSIMINGGPLGGLLGMHSSFKSVLVGKEKDNQEGVSFGDGCERILKSEVSFFALRGGVGRVTSIAIKTIRWLLPSRLVV